MSFVLRRAKDAHGAQAAEGSDTAAPCQVELNDWLPLLRSGVSANQRPLFLTDIQRHRNGKIGALLPAHDSWIPTTCSKPLLFALLHSRHQLQRTYQCRAKTQRINAASELVCVEVDPPLHLVEAPSRCRTKSPNRKQACHALQSSGLAPSVFALFKM